MIRVKQVLNIVKVTPVRTLSSAICARECAAQSKLFWFCCFYYYTFSTSVFNMKSIFKQAGKIPFIDNKTLIFDSSFKVIAFAVAFSTAV